jgi:hypothetical protein
MIAVMMQARPIQATHPILLRVRMLAREKARKAASATKMAVQAACIEIALKPIDMLNMADPATKTQS